MGKKVLRIRSSRIFLPDCRIFVWPTHDELRPWWRPLSSPGYQVQECLGFEGEAAAVIALGLEFVQRILAKLGQDGWCYR